MTCRTNEYKKRYKASATPHPIYKVRCQHVKVYMKMGTTSQQRYWQVLFKCLCFQKHINNAHTGLQTLSVQRSPASSSRHQVPQKRPACLASISPTDSLPVFEKKTQHCIARISLVCNLLKCHLVLFNMNYHNYVTPGHFPHLCCIFKT